MAARGKEQRFLPLRQASEAARAAGWRTQAAYRQGYRAVPGLPSNPNVHYADWPGWPAFLGTGTPRKPHRRGPFVDLATFAREVRLAGVRGGRDYAEKFDGRPDFPRQPHAYYPDWPGWPALTGTPAKAPAVRAADRLPYAQAALVARAAGFLTARDYYAGRAAHPGLPAYPLQAYQGEWQGWEVFLATDKYVRRQRWTRGKTH